MTWRPYAGTVLIVASCTGLAALLRGTFDPANLTMVYLLGVVVAAIAFGRGPAMLAAFLSVAAFDLLFVPPHLSFTVHDTQYVFTFAVMLLVAGVIGTLTASLREQLERARLRQERTTALHHLSHDLAVRDSAAAVLEAASARIAEALRARVCLLVAAGGPGQFATAGDAALVGDPDQRAAVQRALRDGTLQGLGPGGIPGDGPVHVPLLASARVLGVLSAAGQPPDHLRDPERMALLRALASQTALALERCRLAEDAQRARMQAEAERLRSTLLSSVSHDLRTPLAAIAGAASTLRDDDGALAGAARRELADTISEQSARLNRLIGNLLEMTRLESGTLRVAREWHSLEEIVGAALTGLERALGDRPIEVAIVDDLPLAPLDDVLFEQVVRNLVENAHQYAPAGTPITIAARAEAGELVLEVADRGPGFAPGEERRAFEKFYRGAAGTVRPGAGLGLAISRGIVEAHGGRLTACNRPGGGALLTVRVPLAEAPAVPAEALVPGARS